VGSVFDVRRWIRYHLVEKNYQPTKRYHVVAWNILCTRDIMQRAVPSKTPTCHFDTTDQRPAAHRTRTIVRCILTYALDQRSSCEKNYPPPQRRRVVAWNILQARHHAVLIERQEGRNQVSTNPSLHVQTDRPDSNTHIDPVCACHTTKYIVIYRTW
jgi:hypothetical protein